MNPIAVDYAKAIGDETTTVGDDTASSPTREAQDPVRGSGHMSFAARGTPGAGGGKALTPLPGRPRIGNAEAILPIYSQSTPLSFPNFGSFEWVELSRRANGELAVTVRT